MASCGGRLKRFVGVLLMAGVMAAVAALGTWSVADPTFSHATGNIPVNALGAAGAIFADLVDAVLRSGHRASAGSYVDCRVSAGARPAAFPTARGGCWRGLVARSAWRRFLHAFNPPATWPLPVGVGGVLGDLLLKIPGAFVLDRLSARHFCGFVRLSFLLARRFGCWPMPAL